MLYTAKAKSKVQTKANRSQRNSRNLDALDDATQQQDDPKQDAQLSAAADSPVQLLEETLLDIHAAIKFVVVSVISHAFAHSKSVLVSKQGAPVKKATENTETSAAGEGVFESGHPVIGNPLN